MPPKNAAAPDPETTLPEPRENNAPEPLAGPSLADRVKDMLADRIRARESEAVASDALKAAGYTTTAHAQFEVEGRHFMAKAGRKVVEARIGKATA